jgi:hypothetical protein
VTALATAAHVNTQSTTARLEGEEDKQANRQ